jgi:hypothetical protein
MSNDVKARVSEQEWRIRVDLAACYRLVALYGWDDLIFTHISARLPGDAHEFLINPYGMTFDEITASSLVKIGLDGRKLMESPYEINPAGFVIHSAIHAARDDAKCVLHTHSVNGVAVSATKEGVLPISQQSTFVLSWRQEFPDAAQPRPVDRGADDRRRVRADVYVRVDVHDPAARAGDAAGAHSHRAEDPRKCRDDGEDGDAVGHRTAAVAGTVAQARAGRSLVQDLRRTLPEHISGNRPTSV